MSQIQSLTHKQRAPARWDEVSAQYTPGSPVDAWSATSVNARHDVLPVSQSPQGYISPFLPVFLFLMWTAPCSSLSFTASSVSSWSHRWLDSWACSTCVYGSTSSFLPRCVQARPWNLAPSPLDCPASCLTRDYPGLM